MAMKFDTGIHFTKIMVSACLCQFFLFGSSSVRADEAWTGVFAGKTVLEAGMNLPEGLIFDNQLIEFECIAETLPPPFTYIGRCNVHVTYSINCGSYMGVGTYSNKSVDESITLVDLSPTPNIEASYLIQDDTWEGMYYFDTTDSLFCDMYQNVAPFSVSFTVQRPGSQKNPVLIPVYQLLLSSK